MGKRRTHQICIHYSQGHLISKQTQHQSRSNSGAFLVGCVGGLDRSVRGALIEYLELANSPRKPLMNIWRPPVNSLPHLLISRTLIRPWQRAYC